VILADVNVYLGAYRLDSPFHQKCRSWLEQAIASESAFGVSPQVLSAVVRIATNRRAFDPPSKTGDAIGYCEDILRQPHCVVVQPGERHWSIFARLCRIPGIKADLVTDAWFAALAIEHGCEWITLDRDFNRFPGLRWRTPD
jgi:toxin-antitoxin system PIN domain toxin